MNQERFGIDFKLKKLTQAEVTDQYVSWLNDPEVNRFLEVRFSVQTKETVIDYVNSFDQANNLIWGIYALKSSSASSHVGNISLQIRHEHRTGYFGYLIGDKAYWGTSAGLTAVALLLEEAFLERKLFKVWGSCYSTNIGSIFNFQRLGFQREGSARQQFQDGDRRVNQLIFGLLADEWSRDRERWRGVLF